MVDLQVGANQVLEACDSTNTVAKDLIRQGYSHGAWISSRIQKKGRGRLGREWRSESGNLFLSVILKVEDRSLWSWVPLCVSVAVAQVVRKQNPALPIQIKWPNDLWIYSMKVGGVLCESVAQGADSYLVAGIGFNLNQAPQLVSSENQGQRAALGDSVDPLHPASPGRGLRSTCLKDHWANEGLWSLDQFRFLVIDSVLQFIDELNQKGNSRILSLFDVWSALPCGTLISWGDSQQHRGRVLGLGTFGELRVESDQGQIEHLFSEDVSVRPVAE